ncbi:MAG TPA: YceI family protein [Chryseosolibacter sp.]
MKKIHPILHLFAIAAAVTFVSCEKTPRGDNVIITDELLPQAGTGASFLVDTANSWIRFSGAGIGKAGPGTLPLRYGKVTASKDEVSGGKFILDITSLESRWQGAIRDEKSQPHLATGDRLDPVAFGTSQFEITGVEPYKAKDENKSLVKGENFMISGNLQIRNVTKNVTFPARVDLDGNTLKAKANFDIDRRQWELNYGKDKTLDEKSAPETLRIELSVVARPEDPNGSL